MTAAAFTTTASACKPYSQKWGPKPSSEFVLGIISLRNPRTSSTVRRRIDADRGNRLSVVPRAAAPSSSSSSTPKTGKDNDDDDDENQNQNKKNDDREEEEDDAKQQQPSVSMIRLDDVNPVGLGRRSRQIFDEVWRKFSGLGQISRTTRTDDETSLLINEGGPMCEFAIPGAQNTTVLVVGATSRVGRIVVRKLMLRGYTVKVSSLDYIIEKEIVRYSSQPALYQMFQFHHLFLTGSSKSKPSVSSGWVIIIELTANTFGIRFGIWVKMLDCKL